MFPEINAPGEVLMTRESMARNEIPYHTTHGDERYQMAYVNDARWNIAHVM